MPAHPYSPRYWPTWAGLALLRALSCLPYGIQLGIGRLAGRLFLRLARRRRLVAITNLERCLPSLPAATRARILRETFESMGIGMLEMALAWWAPARRLQPLLQIDGLEHLHAALAQGRGVILLSAHFTTLEIGGRLLALTAPFQVMYRDHKNAALEQVMRTARERHFGRAIPRGDPRGLLASLRDNHAVWYAPDQDYGREQSIFVPFFGIPAATITATSRLARISGAAVVPYFPARLEDGRGYRLALYPALENFPGDSVEADTRRINDLIEAQVRELPGQYLWAHRRFKTRPEGEAGFYEHL